ncbi:TPA: hypothetical protein PTV90_002999 [Cronobacter sakazakii]|uniref:hypothetical protein n=1 Tax=Cronobacter sakazakii TaxID=28141 RepID=UPI000CFAE432|nr:hypothetical protein [Cronobacter sakazakii]HDK7294485.1 hypothetical protein [Cronobacter sakazakii]
MSNDELIAAGHELAKCLDSNTPLLDIAKMIVSLADKLGVTTAALREKTKQCEQLAEECAALKDINKWCKTDAFKNMYREFKTAESLGCQDVDCMHDAMLTAIMHAPETPATDAFLREVRASAVDAVCLKISNSIVSCRQDEMIGLDEAVNIASDFAVELRQGGAA